MEDTYNNKAYPFDVNKGTFVFPSNADECLVPTDVYDDDNVFVGTVDVQLVSNLERIEE